MSDGTSLKGRGKRCGPSSTQATLQEIGPTTVEVESAKWVSVERVGNFSVGEGAPDQRSGYSRTTKQKEKTYPLHSPTQGLQGWQVLFTPT